MASGEGRKRLAAETGITYQAIWAFWSGKNIPLATTVAKMADVLSWPGLVTISERLRIKTCGVCEQKFVDSTSGLSKSYCRTKCARTATARQRRESRQWDLLIARRQLALHRGAVGKFCRWCSSDGMCPDANCLLRPVSPLPLPRGEQWAEVRARLGR